MRFFGNLSSLNKYFAKYKKLLLLGILFIIISDATQIYIPILLRDSIDSIKNEINYDKILNYALMILGFAIVSGFFRFLIRETVIVVSRKIEYDLRQVFWEHLQKLSMRFFANSSTGNLMAHATNDIHAVRMYLGPAVMYSLDTVTKFIIIIGFMLSINPLLTLYTLLPLPFLTFFVYKLSKKIHKKFTKIQEKFAEITTKVQENLSGIRVIKSYVREKYEMGSFNKLNNDYLERNMDKIKIQAFFQPLLFTIAGIAVIIVIWAGGSMVIEGIMTLGEISAFIAYLGMLIWPMIAFGWVLNIIQQADASMRRVNKILHEDIDIKDNGATSYLINSISGKIEFKNVWLKYREDMDYILKDINMVIPKGSTVAVIGHTGVGKSTLVNLIPRLMDTSKGQILIDGNDVRKIPLKVLRKHIAVVPQETFLFSDTLENNILYGLHNGHSEELLHKVAEISRIDKDVENFPNKYDTILGERGITLSGGQKQRTCLARALAVDPKILILDDSFSAVDTNTEEEILTRLKEYMKGRTNIIISHRISTVKDSDKIFVMDAGEIVEEGTHEELVEYGGIYADLHYKQLLEQEIKDMN